jgi:cell fate regulator YaaT (PSP1 superfamily)
VNNKNLDALELMEPDESGEADLALAGQGNPIDPADPEGEAEIGRNTAADADIPWRGMVSQPLSEPPVAGVLHGGDGDWQSGARFWNQEDPQESFNAAFGEAGLEDVNEAAALDDAGEAGAADVPETAGEANNTSVSDLSGKADATSNEPVQTELVLGVKLSQYGPVYFFKAGQENLRSGNQVLVDAEQGVSLAEVVIARRLRLPLPKIRTEEGQEVDIQPIRGLAGPSDIAAAADNRIMASSARLYCKECIRERNLDMKLVDVEVLHDRSKIIFYFTAPTRIDFRELVKDLVRNYHTRIELRQIGVRHETQMIGALGNCGMTCCCRRYLRKFAPVTIKMAKEQNLFLNPAKLSGICGRLLCCLSYEQANYEEFHKRSPKIGKKYRTSQGVVKVLRANLFRQSLFIQGETGEETELQLEDWEALLPVRLEQGGPEGPDRVAENAGTGAGQPALAAPPAPSVAAGPSTAAESNGQASVKPDQRKALPAPSAKALPSAPPAKALPAAHESTEDVPEADSFMLEDAAPEDDQSIFGLPGSKHAERSDKPGKPDKQYKPTNSRGRWRKHNKR